MTPKKKAVELVLKFSEATIQYDQAIKCALIAVDEIIQSQKCCNECEYEGSIEMKYWQEVKNKIRKL